MPIRELSEELVLDIVESYGQITKLNLSTNEISRIENLQHLTCLTNLDLFCNRLGSVSGSLDGLAPLTRLKSLDISENSITSLEPLSSAPVSLTRLDVANNAVSGTFQISYLASLTALTELVLVGNPVAEEEDYADRTFVTLPSLRSLDHARRESHTHHPTQEDGGEDEDGTRTARASSAGASAASRRTGFEPYLASPFESMPPPQAISGPNPSPGSYTAPPPSSPGDTSNGSVSNAEGEAQGVLGQDAGVNRDRWDDQPENPRETPAAGPESSLPRLAFSDPNVLGSVEAAPCWDREDGLVTYGAAGGGSLRGESWSSGGSDVFEGEDDGAAAGGSAAGQGGTRLMSDHASGIGKVSAPEGLRERTQDNSVVVDAVPIRPSTPAEVPPPPYTRDSGAPGRVAESLAADNGSHSPEPGKGVQRAEGSGRHFPSGSPRGVSMLSSSPVMSRVAMRSEAIARAGSSFAWGGDRGADGEGARGSPVHATGHQQPAEGGSGPENSMNLRQSEGLSLASSGSGIDDGDTATLRTIWRTKNDRADEAEFGTFAGNCQVTLGKSLAAEESRAPSRVVGSAHETAVVALDRRDGIFDHRGPTLARTSKPIERRPSVNNLAAPVSGSGKVGSGMAGVIGDSDDFHRLGSEKVEKFESPLQATVPLNSGTRMGLLGNRTPEMSKGHERPAMRDSEAETVVVSRGEWETLKRENDNLRRQATLTERRCAALTEMQRLADNALSSAHPLPFSFSSGAAALAARGKHARGQNGSNGASSLSLSSSSSSSPLRPKDQARERSPVNEPAAGEGDDDQLEAGGKGSQSDVARLLAAWRAEVLKLLLQRGVDAEVAAEESRRARKTVSEEREASGRAETAAKSLMQRALAAEAEAELLGIKLTHAFEELREDRAGRCTAEASSVGHATAVRSLSEWVQGFVARASEGFFEREALLARAVAKMEAFSERLGLAAGRVQMLETLLQHKEVQLRNSRAALVADRRVWLLERRDREIAALSSKATNRRASPASSATSHRRKHHPGTGGTGRREHTPLDASHRQSPGGTRAKGVGIRGEVHGEICGGPSEAWGGAMAIQAPLLEGLRPECEAVMRALFCRVDRLGTGAVRARRLLSVLRSDCGVSEVMEAAVGRPRWRAALDSMEAALCDSTGATRSESCSPGLLSEHDRSAVAVQTEANVSAGSRGSSPSAERNVTWGEFLLFFLPSAGSADDAYNAGLVSHAGGHGVAGLGGARHRSSSFGTVSEDAAAMLQMVVPDRWTADGGGGGGGGTSRTNSGTVTAWGAATAGRGGDAVLGPGLAALSVGQLRREVLRLSRERGYLLALVREDSRLGRRRAEAVHDQYRYELRALHYRTGELERSLEQVSSRADAEEEKAKVAQEDLSRSLEEAAKVEQEWKSRVDAAMTEKSGALEELSREASKSANTARERISRLEAQHSLALRENGKASVRLRALERELARIKSSMKAEADVEKAALEERMRAGESKLATARRERNALLAALRDLQKRGRSGSDPLSLFAPSSDLGASREGGAGMAVQELDGDSGGDGGSVASVGGRVGGIGPTEVQLKIRGEPPRASGVTTSMVVSAQGGRAKGAQEQAAPEVARQIKRSGGSCESARVADDNGAELRFGGQRNGGEWQGSGSRGPVHGDAGRAASLSARLEVLALQTQQLLADGSDTSYSAGESDSE
ncbi:unnamed protein product [Scytosiphon promiscuus]